MKKRILISCLLLAAAIIIRAQQSDFPKLTGPYLGQKPPGVVPEVFGERLDTDEFETGGFAFNISGDEVFFFSEDKRGKYHLRNSYQENEIWSNPQLVFNNLSGNKVHPFFSPEGRKLFFGSDARIMKNEKVPYFNLWLSEKTGGVWCAPEPVSATINTGWENCGAFTQSGLFFFRRVSPSSRGDIYQSEYLYSKFTTPVKLPGEINTVYDESHPAISPDGSYLIFSSKRPGGFNHGKDELWVVFNESGSRWSKAVNPGNKINNGCNTSCATISPDGKFIFFIRIENNIGISYWVSAKIIEELRPKE